ncbi:MAG TPA: hypothetical protein VJ840_18665 [Gemmatimonadaceae bacterium]|nr:hypothetical protein [Gemmatimonadaceae bacterium]
MKTPTVEALRASNAAFRLPSVPHIEDHIAAMREKAATLPHEAGRIVDWRTGNTLWESSASDADAGSVDMSGAGSFTIGNLMIHTHPIAAELSVPDFCCCTSTCARANLAVSPDGTLSWSEGIRNDTTWDSIYQTTGMVRHWYGYRGFDFDEKRRPDSRLAALDNYWLAAGLYDSGVMLGEQHNFYSDAVIALMTMKGE